MKKKRRRRKDLLKTLGTISYIPVSIKTVGGFKDKVVRLFRTKTQEEYGNQTVYWSAI